MSSYTITKKKLGLNAKTNAHKKTLVEQVNENSLVAETCDLLPTHMATERRELSSLKGLKKRTRKSEKAQIERVAKSLKQNKQRAPVLIDESGEIIHGHIVVEALRLLGAVHVWCVINDDLDEAQRQLLHVTLNRTSELGEWDLEGLGDLFTDLDLAGFDLTSAGFTLPELDILMSPAVSPVQAKAAANEIGLDLPAEPVSLPGDCWILDKHRLLCADSLDAASYATLVGSKTADLVFTDLPWPIPIENFVSGKGKVKHSNFKYVSDCKSEEEFEAFSDQTHALAAACLKDGGAFYSCIDWRSYPIIVRSGAKAGLRHLNMIVWNKGVGGMGSPYRSAHECIVLFGKGTKLATNNIQLGKNGRDRTNVWTYPGANQPGSSAAKALKGHPTPKPIELVADALKDLSKRGEIVLDPFSGSGTTILAAEKTKRIAYAIDIEPKFIDLAILRWEKMTGKSAIHEETGLSLEELRKARSPLQAAA